MLPDKIYGTDLSRGITKKIDGVKLNEIKIIEKKASVNNGNSPKKIEPKKAKSGKGSCCVIF